MTDNSQGDEALDVSGAVFLAKVSGADAVKIAGLFGSTGTSLSLTDETESRVVLATATDLADAKGEFTAGM